MIEHILLCDGKNNLVKVYHGTHISVFPVQNRQICSRFPSSLKYIQTSLSMSSMIMCNYCIKYQNHFVLNYQPRSYFERNVYFHVCKFNYLTSTTIILPLSNHYILFSEFLRNYEHNKDIFSYILFIFCTVNIGFV